jgi:hypothetical protein
MIRAFRRQSLQTNVPQHQRSATHSWAAEMQQPFHSRLRLRVRRERPRSAAEQRDELAPFYLIELHPIPSD